MRNPLIMLMLSVPFMVNSQQNKISEFLDDGGRSTARNIIKTNFFEFFKSNFPIVWEHRCNDFIAVQAGVGLIANNYFKPILTSKFPFEEVKMYEGLKGGYSLILSPVFYSSGYESYHLAFPIKVYNYVGQAHSIEFNCTFGIQKFISRRVAFDIDLGIGVGIEKSQDGVSYIYDPRINDVEKYGGEGLRLIIPFSFTLGYIL